MKTVLIIENEQEALIPLARLIERRGIKALTAMRGQEGIKLYEENKPDGVLLDLHLPMMDGTEVLKKLKEINPLVKVYFLTGDQIFADRNPPESIGAMGYLIKPIMPQELMKVIESF
ncbi:MAG: response regulator [Candidatus Omnitrophota bacterium]|nr:response regulator [Candidatus Omnitrophota bacterium]